MGVVQKMRNLFGRIVLLLPLVLTVVPVEGMFPLYFLAPSRVTWLALLAVASAVSITQMLYQYWGAGEVERLAPMMTARAGKWLTRQPFIQEIRRRTGITLFILAVIPCSRSFGVALWQTTRYPLGGWILGVGTVVQLAWALAMLVGAGKLVSRLV
jgi:hypothetical protein